MLITAHPNLFDFPVVIAYTEGMPIEEWRKMRKDYIGGSEAYPCLGIGGKYNSRIGVYYDKTSDIMEQSDSERMWAGRMLEPVIAQMFAERSGKTVVKQPYMFRHPDYDFMMANIDFGILGENAGLECKNSAARILHDAGTALHGGNEHGPMVHRVPTGWVGI
jgi:predicted phage-related endonuclease